jgi:hypothetical protein
VPLRLKSVIMGRFSVSPGELHMPTIAFVLVDTAVPLAALCSGPDVLLWCILGD